MALTEEQKRLRVERYGSSEVATILGIGPGKLIDVYESKTRLGAMGEEEGENLLAELGTLLEEPTARVYERRTGTFLAPVATVLSPTRPLAIATPDRARFISEESWLAAKAKRVQLESGQWVVPGDALHYAERLVEVKTTGARYRRDYGAAGSSRVPEEKAVQVTWQMGVTGHRVVDLPVLFRGEWGVTIDTFTVPFNADLFELAYEAVERFHHDHVLARVPPPPDGSARYEKSLKRMFPVSTGKHVDATAEDEALMLRFAQFREIASRATKLKKEAAQQLKARIGEDAGLVSAALGRVTWSQASKPKPKIRWQEAASEFQLIAATIAKHVPEAERAGVEARLKAVIPRATKTVPGTRSLRPTFEGDADMEEATLRVTLGLLGEGPADDEDDDDEDDNP